MTATRIKLIVLTTVVSSAEAKCVPTRQASESSKTTTAEVLRPDEVSVSRELLKKISRIRDAAEIVSIQKAYT